MLTELVYDVQRYMSHVSSLHTCNRVAGFCGDGVGAVCGAGSGFAIGGFPSHLRSLRATMSQKSSRPQAKICLTGADVGQFPAELMMMWPISARVANSTLNIPL
jgi:hypothetical protein